MKCCHGHNLLWIFMKISQYSPKTILNEICFVIHEISAIGEVEFSNFQFFGKPVGRSQDKISAKRYDDSLSQRLSEALRSTSSLTAGSKNVDKYICIGILRTSRGVSKIKNLNLNQNVSPT